MGSIIREVKNGTRLRGYHPAVNFILRARSCSGCFEHPAFWLLSVGLSCTSYFSSKGRRGVRLLLGMLVLLATVVASKPGVQPVWGDGAVHVGRPFTLEALLYGLATVGMFLTVILWFAYYNEIATEISSHLPVREI